MHVYPHNEQFDAESTVTDIVQYSEIEKVDTRLSALEC